MAKGGRGGKRGGRSEGSTAQNLVDALRAKGLTADSPQAIRDAQIASKVERRAAVGDVKTVNGMMIHAEINAAPQTMKKSLDFAERALQKSHKGASIQIHEMSLASSSGKTRTYDVKYNLKKDPGVASVRTKKVRMRFTK